jgi:hypothetical protein
MLSHCQEEALEYIVSTENDAISRYNYTDLGKYIIIST